jgi:nucleoside 2-deoxyribosyltransferase
MMKKKIYIAGPLFNKHERGYLETIAHNLEKEGFSCFLPHRDLTGVEESELKTTTMSQTTKTKIFVADLTALKESDLTVALLTGWDIDSGTSAEIGYTFANGKPIIGIDASERRFRNLFVEGMITEKVHDISAIIPTIKKVFSK